MEPTREAKDPRFNKPTTPRPETEKKDIKPVVNGKIRKETLGKKIAKTFIKADIESVCTYVIDNILLPAVIDTVVDGGKAFIESLFRGIDTRTSERTGRGSGYTSYGSRSNSDNRMRANSGRNNNVMINDIVFDSCETFRENRLQAIELLNKLDEHIKKFECVSISNLYSYANIQLDDWQRRDNLKYYGWTDLHAAEIVNDHGAAVLVMPKPTHIE